jgi:hypothetical protein
VGDVISIYGAASADDSDQLIAQAAAMVGKTVDYQYGDQVLSGRVAAYEQTITGPKLTIDSKVIDLADVVKVYGSQD